MRSRPFENSSGPWLPKRALFILLTLAITLVGTPYIPSAAAVTQCVIKWVEINQNGVNSVDKTVYSGEMLNANAPAFTSGYSSAVFTYSWISSTRGLVATGSSYRPVTADIGSTLLVNASLRCSSPGSYSDSNAGSTGLVASGVPTLSVYQPTQLVAAPTLQETSIASSSAITARQWQRADTSSGTFSNIGGATSTRYKVTITDFNKFIRIVTTYADATTRTSNPVQYLVFDTNSSWTVPTGVSQAYISMTAGVGGFPSINDTATHWTSESSSALSSGRIGGLVSISSGQQLQYYQGSHGNPPSSTNYGGLGGTANLTGSG